MHHLLLRKSPDLDRASLMRCAKEIGLDMKRFVGSLDGMKHEEIIEKDRRLAVSLDLFSTPTFFFNGRKVVGDRPYEYLKKIVEEELAAAR
jgi:predicted DsbA family dithiol-disulfide isomerase